MATPKKFEDLGKDELVRTAIEDFAVDLQEEEKKSKKTVIAALVENSIFWDDYVACHPEVAPEDPAPTTIKSNAPTHGVVGEDTVTYDLAGATVEPVEEEPVHIHVATPVVQSIAPSDQYLLKMVRDNPLFQTRGYTFTEEHPYALVSAEDAQYILEHEDGFRQAFPAELAEFYG